MACDPISTPMTSIIFNTSISWKMHAAVLIFRISAWNFYSIFLIRCTFKINHKKIDFSKPNLQTTPLRSRDSKIYMCLNEIMIVDDLKGRLNIFNLIFTLPFPRTSETLWGLLYWLSSFLIFLIRTHYFQYFFLKDLSFYNDTFFILLLWGFLLLDFAIHTVAWTNYSIIICWQFSIFW